MLKIKVFEKDKTIKIQCKTREEFKCIVKGLEDSMNLELLGRTLPDLPLADALLLLGYARIEKPKSEALSSEG